MGGPFCYFPHEDVHGDHGAQWKTGGCPACHERAAIVAWLGGLEWKDGFIELIVDDLRFIERGEHLAGDDE